MPGDSANDLLELPRRSLPPIKVWVTLEERAEIEIRAAQTGLSVSAYMRAAGLNHPVRSVLDLKSVADLVRVNGDLGRVAGLLKLWLAEKRGQGASPVDVEALMKELWALQTEMRQIMGRAVRGRQRAGYNSAQLVGLVQQAGKCPILPANSTTLQRIPCRVSILLAEHIKNC